jgi:hypothetical protein
MSTIVHYECRNPQHHRGASRRGIGGLVIHHGSVGYCDGLYVDGAHRWVPTGGVPIEFLYDSTPQIDGPGTYRADDGALVHVRPTAGGSFLVEVDGETRRATLRVGVKLSDDPDWPDPAPVRMALLPAD